MPLNISPDSVWWSPTFGLIVFHEGTWWRVESHYVSMRHDGFPNEMPLDAVHLTPEKESDMTKEERDLRDLAEEHGFEFDGYTEKNRLRFSHPETGEVVIGSAQAMHSGSAHKNLVAEFRNKSASGS